MLMVFTKQLMQFTPAVLLAPTLLRPPGQTLNILILGGTHFLGPAIVEEAREKEVYMFVIKLPQDSLDKPEELKEFKTISLNPNALTKYIKLAEEKSPKTNPTKENPKEQNHSNGIESVDHLNHTQ